MLYKWVLPTLVKIKLQLESKFPSEVINIIGAKSNIVA